MPNLVDISIVVLEKILKFHQIECILANFFNYLPFRVICLAHRATAMRVEKYEQILDRWKCKVAFKFDAARQIYDV